MANVIENNLWVEKYRPKTLDDVVLEPETRSRIQAMITANEIPHIIFYGTPGTAKTTTARILLSEIDCDYIEINASLERGIDIVRERVMQFASVRGMKRWRIVLLEEFDNMTIDAQKAFRNFMEKYSDRVRFILTCNYVQKIEPAILSRCQQVACVSIPRKECLKRLFSILDAEGVQYERPVVGAIMDKAYPDMRQMINQLDASTVNGVLLSSQRDDFNDAHVVVGHIKTNNMTELRKMSYRLNYQGVMAYLFDNVEQLVSQDAVAAAQITIAEYMHREASTPDRAINFMALAICLATKQFKV